MSGICIVWWDLSRIFLTKTACRVISVETVKIVHCTHIFKDAYSWRTIKNSSLE